MKSSSTRDPRALRITQQANGREGRTFDLVENEERLILRFVQTAGAPDEAWLVEGRANRAPDTTVVSGNGVTRRAALADLAQRWRECALARGLAAFDWEAMPGVLTQVRGLG